MTGGGVTYGNALGGANWTVMPQDCRSCKSRGMDEHEWQLREQQLMIVEALVQAMDRRDEVFRL